MIKGRRRHEGRSCQLRADNPKVSDSLIKAALDKAENPLVGGFNEGQNQVAIECIVEHKVFRGIPAAWKHHGSWNIRQHQTLLSHKVDPVPPLTHLGTGRVIRNGEELLHIRRILEKVLHDPGRLHIAPDNLGQISLGGANTMHFCRPVPCDLAIFFTIAAKGYIPGNSHDQDRIRLFDQSACTFWTRCGYPPLGDDGRHGNPIGLLEVHGI